MSDLLQLRALRGATTVSANSCEAIAEAVAELLDALVQRNGLEGEQVLSVTFSVTADLDACFPAAIARRLVMPKATTRERPRSRSRTRAKNWASFGLESG